jgi:membrane-bound serine protease (ClpP class)
MLPLLSALSPNAAVLILTAGLALIAFELNRPGSILPGALGLLLSLLAVGSLAEHHPRPEAAVEAAFALLLLQSRRRLSPVVVISATVALAVSLAYLLPRTPGPGISAWAALVSGLIIAAGTTVLTRIARRARQNKGLD